MQNNKTKKLLIELGIYTLLFGLSFLFPIYISYDDYDMKETLHYLPDYLPAYLFLFIFFMVLSAIISKKRIIIHFINVIAALLTLLIYFFMSLGFHWSGGPFTPDFGYGYYCSQLLIFGLVIRSYTLLGNFNDHIFNKRLSIIAGIIAVIIPVLLILTFFYQQSKALNSPIMRSEFENKNDDGKKYREETWDYLHHYSAFADKYYSEKKLPNGKTEQYLDSVRFSYFGDKNNIIKRFTKKSIHGRLDVESILEEEQP